MAMSIREFITRFNNGDFDAPDVKTQIEAGWYDWFCRDSSLYKKTPRLVNKLKQIVNSPKIDVDKMYVFFKNNCPMVGNLYDDFRICDIETGDVIYTVIPASGMKIEEGSAMVWGKENGFSGHLVKGTWTDVKKFFNG